MNWRTIATVYRKELKDALRDRRTLLSTIVIPALVIPLLTFVVGSVAVRVVSKARGETPPVMVLGGEDSPGVMAKLRQSPRLRVLPAGDDWREQIIEKKIRAAVNIPAGFEEGLKAGNAPPVVISHYEGEMKSSFGVGELDRFFRELREQAVAAILTERALPARLVRPFDIKRENVAPPEKVGGNIIGGFVPYLIIILCFSGAMYPAMDLTAGEKERGTMETLLCSPADRADIVAGKFLLVLTGSISAMIFMLLSMGGTALVAGSVFLPGAHGRGLLPAVDPFGMLGTLVMVVPFAVLFSAVIFTVALFAKGYKEAQSYVSPLIIVVLMPAVIGMLPGVELNAGLALVPVLNLSLVCKEMLSGVWHWHYIALIFFSSCAYAIGALTIALKMFNREAVIFRT